MKNRIDLPVLQAKDCPMNMLVSCFDKLSALSTQSLDNDRLQARVAAIVNALDSARIQHGGNDYDVHVARRNLLELIRLQRPAPSVADAFEVAEDLLSARIRAFKDGVDEKSTRSVAP